MTQILGVRPGGPPDKRLPSGASAGPHSRPCWPVFKQKSGSLRLPVPFPPVSLHSRSATMTSHESPGFLHRTLTALAGALTRGILGKSSGEYMKQFTGSAVYWERAIAAQRGWPQTESPAPDPDRFRSSGGAVVPARPGFRGNAPCPSELDHEPVHGWTKRQCDDYLARNPGYRLTYEAELQERCCVVAPGVKGSTLDWFGVRRFNHDKAACHTEPNGTKQARESQTDSLCGL